jgi:hypothetical protein
MPVPELWHWVHVCYGEELGLSTDDEDYASSMAAGKKPSSGVVPESLFEVRFIISCFIFKLKPAV